MEILDPIQEHDVTDYDFMFHGGNKLAIVINHDLGDAVEELLDRYVLITTEKKSSVNPDDVIEAETLEVFKTHLAFVAKCKRKQRIPTAAEAFDMSKFLEATTKGIQ